MNYLGKIEETWHVERVRQLTSTSDIGQKTSGPTLDLTFNIGCENDRQHCMRTSHCMCNKGV